EQVVDNITECQCRAEDGTVVEMCYALPENPEIKGKKFSCDHVKYLQHLELLHRRESFVEDDLLDFTVIVTAASADFYNHVVRLINRMRKLHPDAKVIVYNLGLTPQQMSDLYSVSQVCGLEVRDFDFLAYDEHLRFLEQYRWKPIVIAETLKEFDSIWYMDASVLP
ncbi:hypothetical protein PFISCL1PPCAC_26593, partial [Pristionchus fissidentatus]